MKMRKRKMKRTTKMRIMEKAWARALDSRSCMRSLLVSFSVLGLSSTRSGMSLMTERSPKPNITMTLPRHSYFNDHSY